MVSCVIGFSRFLLRMLNIGYKLIVPFTASVAILLQLVIIHPLLWFVYPLVFQAIISHDLYINLLFVFSIQENSWIIFLLIMAAIFWIYRLVKVFCNILSYWEIRQFYIKALKIRMVRPHCSIHTRMSD